MEAIDVADQIELAIKQIQAALNHIEDLAHAKAQTAAEYEKQLAVAAVKLRNGAAVQLEGQTIVNPPATLIERIARGVCYTHRLEADKAEASYKSTVVRIDALQSILNGYQSIYRHLATMKNE